MKKTVLLILLFVSATFIGLAQKDYKYTTKSKAAIKYFEKAAIAYDYRKYTEAAEELRAAIKVDERFVEAHMMAGDVYADMKDWENSVLHYKRAIELDPAFFPQNFFNLAKSEMRIEKYEDAKTHLEKFLTVSKISPALKSKAEKLLANCVFAAELVKHPVRFHP